MKENSSDTTELRKTIFIDKATIKHNNKYDYSKVVYSNNKTKVEIICPIHGSFWQRPDMHSNVGHGCLKCEIDRKRIEQRIPFCEFLKKSKNLHRDKYDYSISTDYIGIKDKVSIRCKKCDYIFRQEAYAHCIVGNECPKCMNTMLLTNDEFINKSIKIHCNKYDYSKTSYTKNGEKLEIICRKCNQSFFQIANDHLSGHGCSMCTKTKKLTNEVFIAKCKEVHMNKYDYAKVDYKSYKHKVLIKCNRCGIEFSQFPAHHMRGSDCPECVKFQRKSKVEEDFLNYISIPNTTDNRQFIIGNFIVDGFKDGVIYEFLGDFWHGNPEKYSDMTKVNVISNKSYNQLYQETIDRFKYLSNRGYIIKYIWENDWISYIKKKTPKLKIQTFIGENI